MMDLGLEQGGASCPPMRLAGTIRRAARLRAPPVAPPASAVIAAPTAWTSAHRGLSRLEKWVPAFRFVCLGLCE